MFTKEHYVAVAKVLKNNKVIEFYTGYVLFEKLVQDFTELFRENTEFDEQKFLDEIYGKAESK